MKYALAIVTISAAFSGPAPGAEFVRKGDTVLVTGMIQKGDAPKFLETVFNMPQRGSVVLDSRGGYIEDAMAIGHTVRRHEFTTEVRRGAVCYSACSLIWFSGTKRKLHPLGLIGLHSARKDIAPVDERSEAGNARMANFMLEVGVPKAFVDFALMAGPHWITTFNHHQAMSWGLLDSPPPRSLRLHRQHPSPIRR
jgi:hypothetical protein